MSEIAREARTLRSELEQVKRERDLATSQILMVASEICGDPKLDPQDHRDPRWTPTLKEAATLRADAARLRAALRLAEGPIAIAASYADQPCEAMGMRVHAKDCARVLPEIRAALAGEGEAKRCAWKQDADGVWHTDCRSSWVYTDGDGEPADHGQRFCHACGAKVDATPYTNEEDEEEVEDEGQMVSSCECCGCEDCGPPTDVDQTCEECRDLCEQDVTPENARDA